MKKKLPFLLAMALFALLAAVAGYKIVTILNDYRAGEDAAGELQQFVQLPPAAAEPRPSAPLPDAETKPAEPDEEPAETVPQPTKEPVIYPEVDFASLQEINPEVIAWIYIEDTNINYPVVQGSDNRYYLNVMADGRRHFSGSIFMDYRNEPDFSERHTIIYGHNLKNGTMFHNIRKYSDPEFYADHPTGMIMTPEENFCFEVIAGYVARTDDAAWKLNFFTDEDFETWLADTMSRSVIGGTAVPTAQDRIITLSTCTYEFNNARYVLICRIIP